MLPRRPLAVAVALGACGAGVAAGSTFASFSGATANGGSSFTAAPDWTAPTAAAAAIGKGIGATGYIRRGGTYYVYANATDSGNPASGTASVKADISSLTGGQTAVALVPGSYSAGGQTYGYRSPALTADATVPAGSRAYSLTLTDGAGNTRTQTGLSVTVDNTAPRATDVQGANGGAKAGKLEANDTVAFTFSEPVEPSSILSGWTGAATTVRVKVVNNASGATNDTLQVLDATGATTLPITSTAPNSGLDLGRRNFVSSTVTFSGSTMAMSGSTVTVTLGTPSGATGTVSSPTTLRWTPSAAVTDLAGNALSPTTAVSESGGADVDF